jgi:hypothetical protein
MTDTDLDKIFATIYGSSADVEGTWITGLAVACVALRRTDQLNRERLLRGVERELREDLAGIAVVEAKNHASG